MARIVDTKEYLDLACELLAQGQEPVSVPVKGVSMRPFLRDGDLVFLRRVTAPVKAGDILLFQRTTGQYVLHRVQRCLPDGNFLMLGDSQLVTEVISSHQLRAVVSLARIGGRDVGPGSFKWWFFAHPWRWLAPLRKEIYRVYGWVKRK